MFTGRKNLWYNKYMKYLISPQLLMLIITLGDDICADR